MSTLRQLFDTKLIRPEVGDRVQHNATKRLGTVEGRATINGSLTVAALTVKYDDGERAIQISENEFVKVEFLMPGPAPAASAPVQGAIPVADFFDRSRGYNEGPDPEITHEF
jgi:hypothetical protein